MYAKTRHRAGAALLRFAVERSLERERLASKLTSVARVGSTEHANALMMLDAARRLESALLRVGWRLHPPRLLMSGADPISH